MADNNEEIAKYHAQSVPYLIEKSSIYLKLQASKILGERNTGLTFDQFLALETIAFNEGICQRDLSKLILKDRSNITRILNILEEKGLIVRKIGSKKNRIVKTIETSPKGREIIEQNTPVMNEQGKNFIAQFDKDEIKAVKKTLLKMIELISKNADLQI